MNEIVAECSPTTAAHGPRGPGNQQERTARIEARRAFVEMKQHYMSAAADIPNDTGSMLQIRIRKTSEAWELWSLRAVLMASLDVADPRTPAHLLKLGHGFDSLFTGTGTGVLPANP